VDGCAGVAGEYDVFRERGVEGFSGEGKPRSVFYSGDDKELWNLTRENGKEERAEQDRLLYINLERCLRSVFHE
jgi:actin-related protein 10